MNKLLLSVVHLFLLIMLPVTMTYADNNLLFEDNFETVDVGKPPNNFDRQTLNFWGKCSGNCTVITNEKARKGEQALKSYLNRIESNVSFRTEGVPRGPARDSPQKGIDYWYGFSTLIPDSHIPDLLSGDTIAQWHTRTGHPVTLRVIGIELHLIIRDENIGKSQRYNLGQYVSGRWTDWVFHTVWSYQSDGLLELWKDGKKVVTHRGANAKNEDGAPWLKIGLYKTAWRVGNEPDVRFDANIKERIFYHDELRIVSGTDATYADVDPNGGADIYLEQPVGLNAMKIYN